MNKFEIALKEYQNYNRIRNDSDAYLFHMGEWALGESDEKPNPEDYGISVTKQAVEAEAIGEDVADEMDNWDDTPGDWDTDY